MKWTRYILLAVALSVSGYAQTVNPGRVNVVTTPWSVNWLTHANDAAALTDLGVSAFMQTHIADANAAVLRSSAGAQKRITVDVTENPYGADPTGAADATNAIKAASAAAGPNSVVVFPPGRYKLTSTITVPAQQAWQGPLAQANGWSESVAYGAVLVCDVNSAHVTLGGYGDMIGLAFDGVGTGEALRLAGPGCVVRDCLFLHRQYGIYGDDTGSALYCEEISDNTFAAQTSHCIFIDNMAAASPGWHIDRNRMKKGYVGATAGAAIHTTGAAGFATSSVNYNVFDQFEDNTCFILDFSGLNRNVTIIGNHFESLNNTAYAVNAFGRFTILGNYFGHCNAIYANAMTGSLVAANEYDNTTTANVQLGGSSGNNVIMAEDTAKITAATTNILIVGSTTYVSLSGGWSALYSYDYSTGKTTSAAGIKWLFTGGVGVGNSVADANTPSGVTSKAVPIFDAAGNALGYVPVYNAKW